MLAAGFVDEVRALRARGDLQPDMPSMRCVGYRQAWQFLDGEGTMADLRERGIAATRQLAKRQITWLRGMPSRRAIPAEAPDADRPTGAPGRHGTTHDVCGCTDLGKHYAEATVFEHVSLEVASGEFVAIVGESGVGKSTLLNCMAGLDTWDAGTVRHDGTDLGTLDDEARALWRRRHVGFVFQAFHVLHRTWMSQQNVALPLMLLGPHRCNARATHVVHRRTGRAGRAIAAAAFRRPIAARGDRTRALVHRLACCWPTSRPAISAIRRPPRA